MDLGVAGRNYIVLGGTGGMGRESVRLLAEEGANVAVLSRNPHAAKAEFEALGKAHGVRVEGFAADAAKPGEVEAAVSAVIARFGPLRGLAVTNHWMGPTRDFFDIDDAEWELYFQNSLMAAVRAARVALPHMAANGGGSFVLTSAYSARAPKTYVSAYAAFKAALVNLVKSLAKTCGPDGVRVNAVAPGAIRTGRYDERLKALREDRPDIGEAEADSLMLERLDMKVALGRIGVSSEVADLIVFLLSERAAYATGLVVNIDGGTDF